MKIPHSIANPFSQNGKTVLTILMTCFLLICVISILPFSYQNPYLSYGQEIANETSNSFVLANESSPVPSTRERILTDEILALAADIDTIKNASKTGDFQTVNSKTLEVITGPNWGNISADLLYRKDLTALNNFVVTLQSLNSLSKNSTQHTQAVNESIVIESNELVNEYGKVLDALAAPIFDVPKILTNLVLPAIIVVIILLAIPKIRRRYKTRY